MKKNTYRFYFSDNSICELEATSELNAKIAVLSSRKDFGGIPYKGMLEAQRKYIPEWRELYITKVEKIEKHKYEPVCENHDEYCKICLEDEKDDCHIKEQCWQGDKICTDCQYSGDCADEFK